MSKRTYTLPRHTNLARQGSRIGAFLIDLAIFFALTLVFFYLAFEPLMRGNVTPASEELKNEQLLSHLRYKDGDDIVTPSPTASESYNTLVPRVSYYYLNYLTGKDIDKSLASRTCDGKIKNDEGIEVSKKDYYTVAWFNKNVLEVTNDDPDNVSSILFTYPKDSSGNYDKSKICIPKDESVAPLSSIHSLLQNKYLVAYDHFLHLDYVYKLSNKITFTYTLEFMLASFIAGLITYVLIPWFSKNGRTIGKRAFGLALANRDGYRLKNPQLLMRYMPLVVCLGAALIPVWTDIFLIFFVYLIIFLVSFGLAMASPYKASLHDLCARTIVIDYKTSILFNNEMEEDDYLLKEDNIVVAESDGEEPELKYEK